MIGWYVHHRGAGHRRRLEAVAPHLGTPVTAMGSGPRPVLPPGACWLPLPREDGVPGLGDVSAGGTLHWAPLHHRGLRDRTTAISTWARAHDPRALVVDVSVEVAVLARLLGVPTAVVAMRGERVDAVHRLAYDSAAVIVAPWTRATHPTGWPDHWTDRTVWVGLLGRWDRRPAGCTRDGCVVWVAGSADVVGPADVAAAADAAPDRHWHLLGDVDDPCHPRVTHHGHVDDTWPWLHHADVVVGPAGEGLLAEAATVGARMVALPQPRPFREQDDAARHLGDAGAVVAATARPDPCRWPDLLAAAAVLDDDRWDDHRLDDGPLELAGVLDELAAGAVVPA